MAEVRIPNEELLVYQAELRGTMFRALHLLRGSSGVSLKVIANRLDLKEDHVEAMFKGEVSISIEMYANLARAMDARFNVNPEPFK